MVTTRADVDLDRLPRRGPGQAIEHVLHNLARPHIMERMRQRIRYGKHPLIVQV